MKNSLKLRALFFIYLFSCLTSVAGCSLLKKKLESPKVDVDEVKVQKIESGRVFLDLILKVENPNDVDFTVDNMRYSLHVQDREVASKVLQDDVKINKKSVTTKAIPIELKIADLVSSALTLITGQNLPYHAKGEVKIGPFKIPFEEKGDLSLKDL